MRFKNIIKNYKQKIDDELRRFLDKRVRKVDSVHQAKEMMEHIREFTLRGGKRIRPILMIMGYKACGGKKEKDIIKASLSIELMESFLLIHDDIMDQDELRRGYLTMHKLFESKCIRCYDQKKDLYGESMAIIAGDILAALGTEPLLDSGFADNLKIKAIEKFNKAIINTCIGQALDIRSNLEQNVTEEDIRQAYELKTAIYTIETPLQIGGILAGASARQLKQLSMFAMPLGMAFQIHDDILGLFGTREKIGKPVGSDIREGKKTMLIIKAFEECSKKDRDFITSRLGNPKTTKKDIEKIREIIKKTGSFDYSIQLAENLVEKSMRALGKADIEEQGRTFLSDLARYVIEREY